MKKIILLGGMVAVLSVLSSCGNEPSSDNPVAQQNSSVVVVDNPSMERAFETLNDAYCDNLSAAREKKICQDQIALAKAIQENKPEACDALSDKNMQETCFKNVYVVKGLAAKSDEGCNVMKGSLVTTCKDEVNINLAFQSLNQSQCDSISDSDNKEACKNQIIILTAKQKGDANLCNALEGVLQDNCKDNIYYDQSIAKKDKSFCDKIKTDFLKTDCLQRG